MKRFILTLPIILFLSFNCWAEKEKNQDISFIFWGYCENADNKVPLNYVFKIGIAKQYQHYWKWIRENGLKYIGWNTTIGISNNIEFETFNDGYKQSHSESLRGFLRARKYNIDLKSGMSISRTNFGDRHLPMIYSEFNWNNQILKYESDLGYQNIFSLLLKKEIFLIEADKNSIETLTLEPRYSYTRINFKDPIITGEIWFKYKFKNIKWLKIQ